MDCVSARLCPTDLHKQMALVTCDHMLYSSFAKQIQTSVRLRSPLKFLTHFQTDGPLTSLPSRNTPPSLPLPSPHLKPLPMHLPTPLWSY